MEREKNHIDTQFRQSLADLGKHNFYIQEAVVLRRIFKKLRIEKNTNRQIEFIEYNGEKIRDLTEKKMKRGDLK